jgi:hypothetical protein
VGARSHPDEPADSRHPLFSPSPPAAADTQALLALVNAYPVGAAVHFRGYDPTIRPRDWRRLAEQAVWGLRREDALEVTGYGASRGFPDALLVTRASDGATVLVHPPELLHSGASGAADTVQG